MYIEGLFDHITLAKILTHLFVLVPISKDKYFMPALLEVDENLKSPTNDYFAVSFPGKCSSGSVLFLSCMPPIKQVMEKSHGKKSLYILAIITP